MPQKHKLRGLRDAAGLTQKDLSWASRVSTSTISHIECHRGPDVPPSERRPTRTKLRTALKLAAALSQLPPGDYTLEEFISRQALFTEGELYEAAQTGFLTTKPKPRSSRRPAQPRNSERHLRLVS